MMAATTYRTKMRRANWIALVGGLAGGFVAGLVARSGPPGENFWIVFPALLLVCACAFAAALPWWRQIDDVQKSGHLVSWYWGGMGGAVVVLMALGAATGVRSEMSTGAMYLIIGQAVGFLLFWLGWRLRHRGDAA